jgi:AP-1 complex subunit beta-1
MSAVKLVMCYFDILEDDEMKKQLLVKMAPPLVTLLSSESEIQYVALRNINLVVQKQPAVLTKEIKVFFCKYNYPIYCKLEKLEIMIKLTSERNVEQVNSS